MRNPFLLVGCPLWHSWFVDDYFDDRGVSRQRLIWTVATRQQLEVWEALVAENVRLSFANRTLDGAEIWQAAIAHHFALIAACNLIRAIDVGDSAEIAVDAVLRAELVEGRNLHEHWVANLPVFKVTPRKEEPRLSGKTFAERNPDRSPYGWLGWSGITGAMLLPNVSASALHDVLDRVQAHVLASGEGWETYLAPRRERPWIHDEEKGWWPLGR
jgi:hypothetical protein